MNPKQGSRRKFDKEFKMEAVRLALRGDRTQQSVADSLGICSTNLQRWIREYRASGKGAFPGQRAAQA